MERKTDKRTLLAPCVLQKWCRLCSELREKEKRTTPLSPDSLPALFCQPADWKQERREACGDLSLDSRGKPDPRKISSINIMWSYQGKRPYSLNWWKGCECQLEFYTLKTTKILQILSIFPKESNIL